MSSSILETISVAVGHSAGLLFYASLEGALVIAFVWIACPLVARRAPSLRCALWWAACLKLLVSLSGIVVLSLPLLPAAAPPAIVLNSPLAAAGETRPGSGWRLSPRSRSGSETRTKRNSRLIEQKIYRLLEEGIPAGLAERVEQ